MSVRVGGNWSPAKPVYGGVPQGSILGVMLFNVTTDDLEDLVYVSSQEDLEAAPVPSGSGLGYQRDHSLGSPPSRTNQYETSTPDGNGSATSWDVDDSPVATSGGQEFVFLPTARNTDRVRVRDEGDRPVPLEPAPWTSAKWKQRPEKLFKYVDDHIQVLQMNMESVALSPGTTAKEKHAIISQNTFRRVLRKAEGRGMKVNTAKTNMLCVSDAQTFKADGFIEDEEGGRITSVDTDSIKVLGFHFGRRPTAHAHMKSLRKRFYERWWSLYHLKHHGFSQEELVTVYKTCLLYTSPSPRD